MPKNAKASKNLGGARTGAGRPAGYFEARPGENYLMTRIGPGTEKPPAELWEVVSISSDEITFKVGETTIVLESMLNVL